MNEIEMMKDIIQRQEERKKSCNNDISSYENFRNMYFFDNEKLKFIIEEQDAGKISSYLLDIEFMIKRMQKAIDNIQIFSNNYLESRDENFIKDISEYSFLFSSYAYAITNVYVEKCQKNFPINNFQDKIDELFNCDGFSNLVVGVIRNSSIHGKLYYPSWEVTYDFPNKYIKMLVKKEIVDYVH